MEGEDEVIKTYNYNKGPQTQDLTKPDGGYPSINPFQNNNQYDKQNGGTPMQHKYAFLLSNMAS